MAKKMRKPFGGKPTPDDIKVIIERMAVFCSWIKEGATKHAAAAMAGVSYKTIKEWLKRGNEHGAGDHFAQFGVNLASAEASAETVCVAKIFGAEDWRASAWWLERRRPASYSLKKQEIKLEIASKYDWSKISTEDLATVLSIANSAKKEDNE